MYLIMISHCTDVYVLTQHASAESLLSLLFVELPVRISNLLVKIVFRLYYQLQQNEYRLVLLCRNLHFLIV